MTSRPSPGRGSPGILDRLGRRLARALSDRISPAAAPPTAPRPAPPSPAAPVPSPPPAAATARPGPPCTPADLDGVRDALRPRGRPLVVNHWATWCDPCARELPLLRELAERLAPHADFVGVSWDLFDSDGDPAEVAETVRRVAGEAGLPYPSVLFTGAPEALFRGLGLDFQQIPQTVVLDGEGRPAWRLDGEITDAEQARALEEAVLRPPPPPPRDRG